MSRSQRCALSLSSRGCQDIEDPPQHRAGQDRDRVVGAGQPERLGRGRRIERLAGEDMLEPGQRVLQLGLNAFGAW
ncbi:MAG: hypothetical protein ABSA93_03500 [Streptosporangiaceae bacterium]|jgi:hypothetical protein